MADGWAQVWRPVMKKDSSRRTSQPSLIRKNIFSCPPTRSLYELVPPLQCTHATAEWVITIASMRTVTPRNPVSQLRPLIFVWKSIHTHKAVTFKQL